MNLEGQKISSGSVEDDDTVSRNESDSSRLLYLSK